MKRKSRTYVALGILFAIAVVILRVWQLSQPADWFIGIDFGQDTMIWIDPHGRISCEKI